MQRDKSSCCDCEHSQNQHTIYEHDEDSWVKAQQKHSKLNTESICYTTYSALFSGWALLLKLQKSIHPCEVFWVCCCMKSIFKSFLWTFRKSYAGAQSVLVLVVTQKARRMPSIDGCQCFVLKIGGEECVRAAAQPNSKPQTTSIFFFTLHVHIYTGLFININ